MIIIRESNLPDWQDTIIDEVYNVLKNNRIYAEVYDDYDFSGNDNSFVLCVEIDDGDWKHDHRTADNVIVNLLDNYDNIEVTNLGEDITNEDGSDTYSSIHKYHIIRYPDDNGFDFDDIEQLDIKFPNKESVNRRSRKSIKESVDLSDYKFKFCQNGYKIYSKMKNGKGVWAAVPIIPTDDNSEPFEISYDQARGFEPINPTDKALQHKVRQALKMESIKSYDVYNIAYRVADKAHYYLKRGILDYGINVDKQVDGVTFWNLLDELMANLGIQYEVKQTNSGSWNNSYVLHIEPIQALKMESIYTDNGFSSRADYLKSLADDYGVPLTTVKDLASILGPEEDFDGLVTEIEDITDEYDDYEDEEPLTGLDYYLNEYNYVVISNGDFMMGFDKFEDAYDEVLQLLTRFDSDATLYDTFKNTKTGYEHDKIDYNKLNQFDYTEEEKDYYSYPYVLFVKEIGGSKAVDNIKKALKMAEVGYSYIEY